MTHKIIVCEKCLEIISQCRCMACNKEVVWDLCDKCKAKETINNGSRTQSNKQEICRG